MTELHPIAGLVTVAAITPGPNNFMSPVPSADQSSPSHFAIRLAATAGLERLESDRSCAARLILATGRS